MKFKNFEIKPILKLLALSLLLGIIGGVVGALFSRATTLVSGFRMANYRFLYCLPIAGIIIVFLYKILKIEGQSTNSVIESADGENIVSPLLTVGIISSAVVSHLCGASVGREGAAVQIGGSLSSLISKIFKVNECTRKILVRAGLSALFSAVFGTPLAAFLFGLELVTVGRLHLKSAVPAFISSFVGFYTAQLCGAHAERFHLSYAPTFSLNIIPKIIILTALSAILSIIFCYTLRYTEKYAKALIKNPYIRAIVGGIIIILLSLAVKTHDYNGAGTPIIEKVFNIGEFSKPAFILKLIFTAISIGFGFKGGEIVPTLFVGTTFGAFMSGILGLPIGFCAALCMVLMFCGVTNCPLASIALSFELFSGVGFWYFVPAVALCFLISGKISLYKAQKIELPYKFGIRNA